MKTVVLLYLQSNDEIDFELNETRFPERSESFRPSGGNDFHPFQWIVNKIIQLSSLLSHSILSSRSIRWPENYDTSVQMLFLMTPRYAPVNVPFDTYFPPSCNST